MPYVLQLFSITSPILGRAQPIIEFIHSAVPGQLLPELFSTLTLHQSFARERHFDTSDLYHKREEKLELSILLYL